MKTQTKVILVPPPPIPPGRVAAGASGRGEPHRGRAVQEMGFVTAVRLELQRVVWPSRTDVGALALVTIGLLSFFAVYIGAIEIGARWVLHTIGVGSR